MSVMICGCSSLLCPYVMAFLSSHVSRSTLHREKAIH